MLELLQWPAMALTLAASWLVASKGRKRRLLGFWTFLLSNVLWVGWAWPAHAYAVVALQIFLTVTNVRGILKSREGARDHEERGTKSAHGMDSTLETSDV